MCGSALGGVNAESRGVRFILRSFELDALAPSAAEADAWVSEIYGRDAAEHPYTHSSHAQVRGVNALPLGSKHLVLLELARKHHARADEAAEAPAPPAAAPE